MASRSQWKMIAIMTSFILTSSWHHPFCLHQDGGFTKLSSKKRLKLLPLIYKFSGLIRNNIIQHYNLKCKENWWKAAYHVSSVQCVVSYALCVRVCVCVCVCMMSEFPNLHHFTPGILPAKLIMDDIKIFVQNKIFLSSLDSLPYFKKASFHYLYFARYTGNV